MIPFIIFGSLFMAALAYFVCAPLPGLSDKDDDDTDYTDPFFR